jgi:hypothetical protein
MASIPLTALHVAQQPDPSENFTRLLALRNQLQNAPIQRQILQQQATAGEQENQQRALTLKDQDTLRTSAKDLDWSQPDTFDKWMQNAQQNGVSPQTLSALALQRAQYKDQLAKTDTSELAAQKETNNQFLGHIDAIKNVKDPTQRAQVAQDQASQVLSNPQLMKRIDPTTQQLLMGMKAGQVVPTDDQLQSFEMGLTDHNAQIEQQLKVAQTGEAISKGKEAGAQTAKLEAEMGAPLPLPADIAEAAGVPQMAGQNVSPAYLKSVREAVDQGNKVVSANGRQLIVDPTGKTVKDLGTAPAVTTFNLQNAASPSDIKDTAQLLASNQMKWSDILAARTPLSQKIAILKEVKAINPDYNSGDFDVEKKVKEAFTSGSYGQQLTAISTSRNHMATFKQTAEALDNGNFLLANKVGNWLGTQFGSDKSTNFNVARSAFAGEVGKAFAGANVGVEDRRDLIEKINNASSWDQLKGYADTADELLAGKQKSLKESYQQGVQAKPNFGDNSTTPKAGGNFWDQFPEHK